MSSPDMESKVHDARFRTALPLGNEFSYVTMVTPPTFYQYQSSRGDGGLLALVP